MYYSDSSLYSKDILEKTPILDRTPIFGCKYHNYECNRCFLSLKDTYQNMKRMIWPMGYPYYNALVAYYILSSYIFCIVMAVLIHCI